MILGLASMLSLAIASDNNKSTPPAPRTMGVIVPQTQTLFMGHQNPNGGGWSGSASPQHIQITSHSPKGTTSSVYLDTSGGFGFSGGIER